MVLKIRKTVVYVGLERTIMFDVWIEQDEAKSTCIRVLNVSVVISRTRER